MADETTPDGKRLALLRRQATRQQLLEEAREELRDAAPDYDDDEPSVVTVRAEGAAAEKLLARIRKDSPVPQSGPESIRVKAGKLLERRYGKTVAGVVMTVLGLVFAAVVDALLK